MADHEAETPCCPSCSVAVPDEAMRCSACGWDFSVAPPLGGFAIPPARNLDVLPISPLNSQLSIPNSPGVSDLSPDAPAMLLPTSSADGAQDDFPPRPDGRTVDGRLAAAVGSGLGLICVVALYTMKHTSAPAKTPISVEQPPLAAPMPPPPAAAPAPPAAPQTPVTVAQPQAPAPKKQRWIFTGVIYDLLTTKGVFGVGLIFYDGGGQEIGATESDEEGRYRVSLPEGEPDGYTVRITHEDYSEKHIDEKDGESAIRTAALAQRQLLMRSRVRPWPWVGVAGRRMRRDVGLVPLSVEKP